MLQPASLKPRLNPPAPANMSNTFSNEISPFFQAELSSILGLNQSFLLCGNYQLIQLAVATLIEPC